MTLKRFIKKFVEPNSCIRLWKKTEEGHECIYPINKTFMEHELLQGTYSSNHVIGVTDILVNNHCSEAINIVVK